MINFQITLTGNIVMLVVLIDPWKFEIHGASAQPLTFQIVGYCELLISI